MTNNLFRRIKEHEKRKDDKFELVHCEECKTRKVARKREMFWNSGIGREVRDKYLAQ